MTRLTGKIALITGAASGIGAATARRFIAEGAQVVLADIAASAAQKLASELGAGATYVALDVTREDSWESAIHAVRERHGRLDVLVNSAGISVPGDIESETLDGWHRTQSINSDGIFLGCKHGLTLMVGTTRSGAIINLSSTLGLRPQPAFISYGASKASVWALTRAIALHCCEKGHPIRVNAVHPGATHTEMMQKYLDSAPDPNAMLQMFAANHPMKRVGRPEELANAILFLASDEASFITGVSLPVDGGFCAA